MYVDEYAFSLTPMKKKKKTMYTFNILQKVMVTWLGFGGPTGLGKRQLLKSNEHRDAVDDNNNNDDDDDNNTFNHKNNIKKQQQQKEKKKKKTNPAMIGGELVDYVICDSTVIEPFEAMRGYTESLAILPFTYQPQDELQNDIAEKLGLTSLTRHALALKNHHRRRMKLNKDKDKENKSKEVRPKSDHDIDDSTSSSSSSSFVNEHEELTSETSGELIDNSPLKYFYSFDHIRKGRHERYGFPPNAIVLACLNRNNKVVISKRKIKLNCLCFSFYKCLCNDNWHMIYLSFDIIFTCI
jgi:hypothetical protein